MKITSGLRAATPSSSRLLAVTLTGILGCTLGYSQTFTTGNILVSRSVYSAPASTITVGQTLPNGASATNDASYPNVFKNETPDPSFGITSPIFLDQLTTSGSLVNSLNVTSAVSSALGTDISTSFPSKSEIALNLSSDGTAVTFMSYVAPINTLDVSNSNTPGHVDPTNLVGNLTYQRAIVQFDASATFQVTPVNSYSGNNGRAAILANGNYYTVGNAGNSGTGTTGSTLSMLSDNTGVQMIAQGTSGNTTTVGIAKGTNGSTTGYQRGFSLSDVAGFAADKTGKDDNFRGLTLNPYNNTLYVTKGSGGNGINTVYQVGSGGTPTTANAGTTPVTIVPGFSTTSAKTGKDAAGVTQPVYNPFGLWFANATTLYVADEGNGTFSDLNAGLEKWTFDGTKWNQVYTLQSNLITGTKYSIANGPNGEVYDSALDPAATGLRNITGQVNGDGTVTIFGITATASAQTDQGADPNQLVSITDSLGATSLPGSESFTVLKTAGYGEVLRGVSFTPTATAVPEPSTWALLLCGLGAFAYDLRRRSKMKLSQQP